jgi:trimeric autotransporter adhesin
MNSFKKIALAMVAAMTLGTIVATPASAAVMTVAVDLAGTPNTTASAIATPASLPVPADNSIDAADALKFVATVDTGTAVTVSATNATIVSALHTSAAPVGASSGTPSLTIATGTGTTATFWVYTKTTAIGTVTVTNQGTTFTYYVQGQAGKINNLAVSAPSAGAAGTKQDILVTATDVFGNKVSGKSLTATVFAATAVMDSATATTGATLSDFGVATFKATLPATGTRSLIMFAPTTAGDASTADVVGLTVRTLAPFAEIAVRDLVSELAAEKAAKDAAIAAKAVADAAVVKAAADAVVAKAAADKALADAKIAADAALAAAVKVETDKAVAAKVASDAALAAKDTQIAKLTADNAASLKSIKDAFNALAKKWNAKNPKAKVILVK